MTEPRLKVLLGWRLAAWAEAAAVYAAARKVRPPTSLAGAEDVQRWWQLTFIHHPGTSQITMMQFDWQWATRLFDEVVKELRG